MKIHHLLAVALVAVLSASCTSSAERIEKAANEAVAVMAAPERPFSDFRAFQLAPMRRTAEVSAEEKKVEYATKLENMLAERLQPLFDEWHQSDQGSGALRITPELQSLRIVSGGARFWVGAFAGDSNIEMDLVFNDAETGDLVGRTHVGRNAGGMAGNWSVGASDRALLDYIVEIAHHYMAAHYGSAMKSVDETIVE